jgi:phenylpropionate dioxygenase-like ring-hydroxylating dioxygenase large terminal subunit
MLSKEENDTLTRVGPGTIMGDLLRQYWLPFLYSWEVEPDGPPLRVRLLGEDLIVFRDTDGKLGLLGDHCAHRGASLFFGRNEECGLRCVYHGWKYDWAGNCVDMPNEPAESNFKNKITATAYRAAEQGGVVFAYMGPRQADPPGLPQFEWALLPENQVHHEYKAVYQCNWMQALEGDLDTAHVFFLHSRLRPDDTRVPGAYHPDRSPRLEIVDTDYGLMYGARRVESPGQIYWRTTQFLMPVHTVFPAFEDGVVPVHIWVPIDDDHSLIWGIRWNPTQEIPERKLLIGSAQAGVGLFQPERKATFYGNWWPAANMSNDFLVDRAVQRTQSFTGIPTIRLQDAAMTTSMGTIADRGTEHLGTTDTAIIRGRQRLLRAAKALRADGVTPPGVDQPELFKVRSCSAVLPEGVDWRTALEDWHLARTTEVSAAQAVAERR